MLGKSRAVMFRPAHRRVRPKISRATAAPEQNRQMRAYSIQEALRAQNALREAAGLGPELFPIEAFVGMISDEIEALRSQGKTDTEIAALITENSKIQITAEEISANYAPPENRRHGN